MWKTWKKNWEKWLTVLNCQLHCNEKNLFISSAVLEYTHVWIKYQRSILVFKKSPKTGYIFYFLTSSDRSTMSDLFFYLLGKRWYGKILTIPMAFVLAIWYGKKFCHLDTFRQSSSQKLLLYLEDKKFLFSNFAMVKKWYFETKIVLTYCDKKLI